jgi:hypothetical protein
MHVKLVVAALLAAVCAGCAGARADDAIKPGKWQYTTTMQMPNMPQLPPGVKLPPNVQMQNGRGGMTVTTTQCITAADPSSAALKGTHVAERAGANCTTDHMDRSGGTASWAMTCATPEGGTMHIEGTAHYDGDQMEADVHNTMTSAQGQSFETSVHATGQYLGPCDGN